MFKDLVLKNRSYRGYDTNFLLTREDLLELVDLARFVPTSVNQQALKYYLVYDPDKVRELLAISAWALALKDKKLPYPGQEPSAMIVVLQDTSIAPAKGSYLINVGIAAQTILLGASERGLGGCINVSFQQQKLRKLLSLSDELEPVMIIALGKPAENIQIVPVGPDGNTAYYRDENDIHYVPKRSLNDIVVS